MVQGCWHGLRLAHRVAQVGNADARNHGRVAQDGWRAGEVVKESNPAAKKSRRDVDVDFVHEASIQALLDGVSAVDPNGLPGCGYTDAGTASRTWVFSGSPRDTVPVKRKSAARRSPSYSASVR